MPITFSLNKKQLWVYHPAAHKQVRLKKILWVILSWTSLINTRLPWPTFIVHFKVYLSKSPSKCCVYAMVDTLHKIQVIENCASKMVSTWSECEQYLEIKRLDDSPMSCLSTNCSKGEYLQLLHFFFGCKLP